jgi:hypothetical protein
MTDTEKNELAQTFMSGLRNRDWNLLRSIMTSGIIWTVPGSSLISGEARGVDAVIERAQRIVSYGLTFTLKRVLIGQHGLALSLHNTAKRGDVVLDEHLATVCILQDAKVCAIHTYLSDVNMPNAFFV